MSDHYEEVWHFREPYKSREEVEAAVEILDGSTLSRFAECPRMFQLEHESSDHGLVAPPSRPMAAGSTFHYALDLFYAGASEDEAIAALSEDWEARQVDSLLCPSKYSHLTLGHLTAVLKNYFTYWKTKIEVYTPITRKLDDLNLERVLAAKFRVRPDGTVLLGESSIIMEFDVPWMNPETGEVTLAKFNLAGKPDLPVQKQDGRIYPMDHKTTSGWLSDWWASRHAMSNKLRGYMAVMKELLDLDCSGAVINAIHVGPRATDPSSKATMFNRYQFDFSPGHVTEALQNQLALRGMIHDCRRRGYWPQTCERCRYPQICGTAPDDRMAAIAETFTAERTLFFDIGSETDAD